MTPTDDTDRNVSRNLGQSPIFPTQPVTRLLMGTTTGPLHEENPPSATSRGAVPGRAGAVCVVGLYLYRVDLAKPSRVPSPAQREALEKALAAPPLVPSLPPRRGLLRVPEARALRW